MYGNFCLGLVQAMQFTDELHSTYISLCVVNTVSGAVSTATNILVMLAIRKMSASQSPSFVLIFTLAIADLGVGFIVQPLYVAARVAELSNSTDEYCCLSMAYRVSVVCLSGLSFLVMTAISVDRFLAICLCMKYRMVVTRKRTIVVTVLLAIFAIVWAITVIFSPTAPYAISLFLMPSCLLISSFNYLNIHRMLRKQQIKLRSNIIPLVSIDQIQEQSQNQALDIDRYKAVLHTMLYIYIVFVLCYLPYLCYLLAASSLGHTLATHRARHITATIIFLNSSLNPVLYFWRIPEIREATRQLFYRDCQ